MEEGNRAAVRRRARRRPYAIKVPAAHLISAYSLLGLCAGGGLVAAGVALTTPPLPVFLALFALVPAVLLLWLFSRRMIVFGVSELGLRFGIGGLTGRLMHRGVWFPGRRRPVIVRWQSIREIVIRSGPATGDSRVTAEIGVLVNERVKVPRGWRMPDSARPTPTDCPYWQRFPPGRVDVAELTGAIADLGGVRPTEPEPTQRPYHLYRADRTSAVGVGIGVVAWAAALFVRLVGGDGLALLAAPLFLLGGTCLGLAGFRRDKRLLSLDDGGLRFGRPIAFVPWPHIQRVVVDGQLPGTLTLALRLGPESRLPRLYERRLPGADPVSLATALSLWLPGRIRLVRKQQM